MIRLIFGFLVCLVSACSPSIQESNSKNIKLHAQVQKNIFALHSTGKPLSVHAHSNELKPLKSYPLQPLTGRVILQPQQFIAQKLLEVSSRTIACYFQIHNHVKPERVTANPPYTRDQNGASFCCYGKQQGLRHNRIYDLLEDSNRAVWMATNEGLVRFNGFFYDHYNRHSGLPGNYIRCLIRDRNQHIWCGSEEGHLVWIKNNQLGILKITDFNLPPVKCLYEDADSTIWIGTEKGLYKLNSKGIEAITQFSSSVIASISGFRNQIFITSNEWGLAVYRAGKFYTYDTRLTGIQVQGHFVNSNQEVLAYSSEKGLLKIQGDFIQYIKIPDIHFNKIYRVFQDVQKTYWIATDSGILKLDSIGYQLFTEKEGLSDNTVYSILQDSQNELWFGTRVNLSKYSGHRFRHITHASVPIGERIWGMSNHTTSPLLCISNSGELSQIDSQKITLLKWQQSWLNPELKAIVSTPYNHFIASDHGISKLQSNRVFHFIDSAQNLSQIQTMAYNSFQKRVWMGARNGALFYWQNDTFYRHPASEVLKGDLVTALQTDSNALWIATQHGHLYNLQHTCLTQFDCLNLQAPILALHKNSPDILWIGTEGEGLWALKNKTNIKRYNNLNGLPNLNIISLYTDSDHRFWVGTRNGLAYLKSQKTGDSLQFESFQFRDGFVGIGLNAEHAIKSLMPGTLMLATNDRLTQLNTRSLQTFKPQLNVELLHLRIFNYDVPWQSLLNFDTSIQFSKQTKLIRPRVFRLDAGAQPDSLELHYKNNTLEIAYSAVEAGHPESVEYSYRVLGISEDWSQASAQNVLYLTQLPSGSYTIQIRSRFRAGDWGHVKSIYLIIRTPFWRTNGFLFFAVGLVLAFIYGLYKQRTRILEKRRTILEVLVKKRTSELQQQHTQIAQQHQIISQKQQEILDSLQYARKIQYALLAHDDFLKQHLSSFFVFYKTKDVVSGDFYWATKKNSWFYIAVCDSTGHGVPGAFMSLLNMSFMNEAINEQNIVQPGQVFQFVKQRLIQHIGKDGRQDGFDGILLAIHETTRELCYAAANNKPILIHKQASFNASETVDWIKNPLPCDRMAVGLSDSQIPYKTFSFHYNPGDMLYLCSDGYADQFGGPQGKKFKNRRFYQLLQSLAPLSESDQHFRLNQELELWMGSQEQVDDMCIIGIRL